MIIVNNTQTQQPTPNNKDEKKTTSKENSTTISLNDGKTILKSKFSNRTDKARFRAK